MTKLAFKADQVFNNKIPSFYGDVCPVDMNAGYVAQKTHKWGMDKDASEVIEHNIQERFGLETPDGGKSC